MTVSKEPQTYTNTLTLRTENKISKSAILKIINKKINYLYYIPKTVLLIGTIIRIKCLSIHLNTVGD